ncbi:MAG TPA: SUF system NifU family Fe-S cluster assembly protein [Gemmatimonadaceae bacterium]|jgi:nitrogen fixation NifU-like protein|nr:SUF system NifU family Fe-S cluster assembly protein [Gemmatimonadaceae bacterium]
MQPSDRSAQISALYQEMILDHYRRPRNKGAIENATHTILMKNPLCGDEIEVQIRYDGDSIADIGFSGRGCSISQASASMMTQMIKGKSIAEIDELRTQFRNMVMGADADENSLGSLRALSGVARFPARVKCALLAWNALEEAQKNRQQGS